MCENLRISHVMQFTLCCYLRNPKCTIMVQFKLLEIIIKLCVSAVKINKINKINGCLNFLLFLFSILDWDWNLNLACTTTKLASESSAESTIGRKICKDKATHTFLGYEYPFGKLTPSSLTFDQIRKQVKKCFTSLVKKKKKRYLFLWIKKKSPPLKMAL